jgi:hypothetical protein
MTKLARVTTTAWILIILLVATRGSAAAQGASAEEQLAQKYAPIAMLRQQTASCDKKGEGYFPAPVDLVLGNPEVALKQIGSTDSSADDPVIKMGPTAQDLAGKDDTYYLDFPGNPRKAKCDFENNFKRFATLQGAKPTTYVHIVVDQARGQLALQYWFWYYFNDWNNTHETDWEMIQLIFNATSAQQALSQDPAKVGYAQHGGGELADWGTDKIAVEDGHPLVYPGAGSHATYFGAQTYVGWGESGTGFGCDRTYPPNVRTPLNPVLVPDTIDPNGPFAWLLFGGRWGQRESWEFNGPNGPNLGTKWNDPFTAMADWRTSSIKVPTSKTIGPNATDFFCNASAVGSKILIQFGVHPWLLLAIIVAILGGIGFLFVAKRHEIGDAFGIYRAHLATFLGIGLLTIPIGIIFNGLAILAREYPPAEWVVKWFNDTAGARLAAAAIVGGFQQVTMILLVSPPVIEAVRMIRAGEDPGIRQSFRTSYRRIWTIALAILIIGVILGALVVLIIGIPIALWLAVRWQFFGQAVILEDVRSARSALRQSRETVRGRWWHALGDSLVFQIIALLPGPFVGALLMLLGKTSVQFANVFSSVVFAVTVPISIIGLTIAYKRYRDRPLGHAVPEEARPAQPTTPKLVPEG